jgi:carboxylate-amine ligase
MPCAPPALTLGIEEEYLLVDAQTRELANDPPASFSARCEQLLGERVTHEFLRCQVEIGTAICANLADVRRELIELRGTVARVAAEHDLRLIAASTHPWSNWHSQEPTDMERYRIIVSEHQTLVRRMVVCGMHIHAGIEDQDLRVDLMGQMAYFLPHLLALSTSSPFWEGDVTGLKAFRPTIWGDMPRTGLPEVLSSWGEWQALLVMLQETFGFEDASKIWWDIRPSGAHPTLEVRVCEVCTDLEQALSLVALYQSLLAFLYRLRRDNQRWRQYRRILLAENKWRAQRYGTEAELADFGRRQLVPLADLVEELIALLGDHAADLGCLTELEGLRKIVADGNSADHQLRIYGEALDAGASERVAQVEVVDWLVEHSVAGC